MQSYVSPIWRHFPSDLVSRTERCIHTACERLEDKGSGHIFFRADDVAVPGRNIAKLMDLFKRHQAPLCLAVVPAWLTGRRWQTLKGLTGKAASLWCWHQHGWRHINHEAEGKKQEFGAVRSRLDLKRDLVLGKRRLEDLMETDFYPVFTPPWNRCSLATLQLLGDLGYAAVSRSRASMPQAPRGLPDFYTNVDLHTRKERNPALDWKNLLEELQPAISSKFCGIMIHHQRMNEAAFDFLEMLIRILVKRRDLQLVNYRDLKPFTTDNEQLTTDNGPVI
jgi:peptidoglycan/xylan/chitin deacetylase (PgdA/CDA1 family)